MEESSTQTNKENSQNFILEKSVSSLNKNLNGSEQQEKASVFKVRLDLKKNIWTPQEDLILKNLVLKFGAKKWNNIAKYFDNKSSVQCSARYRRMKRGIKKDPWSIHEDKRLLELINIHGKNWSLISKIFNKRSGKQIRERYINNLDPNIVRREFTEEEDNLINELQQKYGNKWTIISKYFDKRTGDMIKNRFHSFMKNKNKSNFSKFIKIKSNECHKGKETITKNYCYNSDIKHFQKDSFSDILQANSICKSNNISKKKKITFHHQYKNNNFFKGNESFQILSDNDIFEHEKFVNSKIGNNENIMNKFDINYNYYNLEKTDNNCNPEKSCFNLIRKDKLIMKFNDKHNLINQRKKRKKFESSNSYYLNNTHKNLNLNFVKPKKDELLFLKKKKRSICKTNININSQLLNRKSGKIKINKNDNFTNHMVKNKFQSHASFSESSKIEFNKKNINSALNNINPKYLN